MFLLLLFIALAIGVSFLCSILEAVILSCTPTYLESIRKTRSLTYNRFKHLHINIEQPLAAILSLNTFAHTIGAAGAGAQAQIVFGNKGITLFSILLTLAILFASEIIPKSIGARYWRLLLPFTSRVLPVLVIVTYPLVFVGQKLSRLIKGDTKNRISREEIRASGELGFRDGSLSDTEHRIFKGLMHFPQTLVHSILIPASKVSGVHLNQTTDEAFLVVTDTTYSRLPVFDPKDGSVKGYVLRNEILMIKALDQSQDIKNIMKEMLKVPQKTSSKTLFLWLLKRHEHIAAIENDDGEFMGIVTLEDILETLLNHDILDEMDEEAKSGV